MCENRTNSARFRRASPKMPVRMDPYREQPETSKQARASGSIPGLLSALLVMLAVSVLVTCDLWLGVQAA